MMPYDALTLLRVRHAIVTFSPTSSLLDVASELATGSPRVLVQRPSSRGLPYV